MTLVAEPVAEPGSSTARPRRRRAMAPWRLAGRLARREVRRRPGRTALVAVLVALPVMGMAGASTWRATTHDAPAERFSRRAGNADVRIQPVRSLFVDVDDVVAELPAGSTWVATEGAYVPLRTAGADRAAQVLLTDLDLDDPLTAGIVEITEGRAPGPGEVLLDAATADAFDVDTGDELALDRPQVTWTVSGIGRSAEHHDARLAVAGDFDFERVRRDHRSAQVLVDLPDDSRAGAVTDRLAGVFGDTAMVESAGRPLYIDGRGAQLQQLAWGWVAGVIALAAMGVIIAAAFATSARRQLATIGQLSANGATPGLVRRTLAMQGAWSGLVGALAGTVVAIAASLAGHDVAERIANRSIGSVAVSPLHLAVIVATAVVAATLAALVPARTAARVPVLAALAGRRPVAPATRRLAPWALGMFVAGLVLLAGATASDGGGNLAAVTATVGGLALLAGLCAISPLAVDALGYVPAGGEWRVAWRSLMRQRSRTAGVVTAIATVGAIACATGTLAVRVGDEGDPIDRVPYLPPNMVVATGGFALRPGDTIDALDPADTTIAEVDEIVPGATRTVWTIPTFAIGTTYLQQWSPGSFVVADDAVLDVIGLSERDRHALDDVGALAMGNSGLPSSPAGRVELTVPTTTEHVVVHAAVRQDVPSSWGGLVQVLVTPARVAELGWATVDGAVVWQAEDDLSAGQRDALDELQSFVGGDDPYVEPDRRDDDPVGNVYLQYDRPTFQPTQLQGAAVVVAGALVLTLLVVAIGLSLAATEGRDEGDVLVAIGAPPALLRRLSARRALTMTTVAAVLAIPVGYLPVVVSVRAVEGDTATFPTLTALGLLVVIPLVAAGSTWLISAAAQRLRPPRTSTLTFD